MNYYTIKDGKIVDESLGRDVNWPSDEEQALARDKSFNENVRPTAASRALSHDIGFDAAVAWLRERISK